MPFTAELKGAAQKALKKLLSKELTKEQKPIDIVFGISVPTEETETQEATSKESLIKNSFSPEKFTAMLTLLSHPIKTKATSNSPSVTISTHTMALVGDSVKRFILASRSNEQQPKLTAEHYLTKHTTTTHIVIAASYEKYKAEFLAIAEKYREQAKELAEKWKASSGLTITLQNDDVINYQQMLEEPNFGVVYKYIENLFKEKAGFQDAVLRDADQFVMRESERYRKNNDDQELDQYHKAIIRYYSVLHFLEEATVFVLLGITRKADAFAYPGEQLGMYGELKKAENWTGLQTAVGEEIEIKQMSWLQMSFKPIKQQLKKTSNGVSSSSSSSSSFSFSGSLSGSDEDAEELEEIDGNNVGSSYSNALLKVTRKLMSGVAKKALSVDDETARENFADYTVRVADKLVTQIQKANKTTTQESSPSPSSSFSSPSGSLQETGMVYPSPLSSSPKKNSPPTLRSKNASNENESSLAHTL